METHPFSEVAQVDAADQSVSIRCPTCRRFLVRICVPGGSVEVYCRRCKKAMRWDANKGVLLVLPPRPY